MKRERAKKLRDACSLLAIGLVAVTIACLVLTGILSALKLMTWAVGLFVTLKTLVGVLFGGVLGLTIGFLVGRKQVVLLVLFAVILIALFVFLHMRVSDLLSVYTPAMSGIVAPVAESLPDVGFLVGLIVGSRHFIRGRKGNSANTSSR
jgi:membrane protease YdiL (CAAX protease family)